MTDHARTPISLPSSLVLDIADGAEAEGVSFNEFLRRATAARIRHLSTTDSWAAERLEQLADERARKANASVSA